MKKILFVAALLMTFPLTASAGYCPTNRMPVHLTSTGKMTTTARCRCRAGARKGKMTLNFKNKRSFSMSKAKRWAIAKAKGAVVKACRKYGTYVSNVRIKVYRTRVKNVLGFNSGYVKLRYSCNYRQKKFRVFSRTHSNRLVTRTGKSTYFNSLRGIKYGLKDACRFADIKARVKIKKRFGRVVYYKRTGYSAKRVALALRCTVKYCLKYKPYGKRAHYFCR